MPPEQKVEPKDSRTKTLIYELKNWDGKTSADSVETSFLEYSRHALMVMLLQPYIDDQIGELRIVGAGERVRQRLVAG